MKIVLLIMLSVVIASTSYALPIQSKMYATVDYEIDDPQEFIIERIKLFEGFRCKVYRCSVSGVRLQGYGRHIGTRCTPAQISIATAHSWLVSDIRKCTVALDTHLPWWRELSTVRQAALLDLCYNLGIHKLKTFTGFLSALQRADYECASRHLLYHRSRKSKYSRQVGIRSKEIATAIRHGVWIPMKEYVQH